MSSVSQKTSLSAYNHHHSHRPSVEVKLGSNAQMQHQMIRASDIESQLIGLTKKSSGGNNAGNKSSSQEEKASKLRMQLCELLSDILLTEPSYSLHQDCVGRLWRSCFYTPIGQFRSRISREKRKSGNNDGRGGTPTNGGSGTSSKVTRLEKQLFHFLSEAVTLYDYLVSQYRQKLFECRPDDSTISNRSGSATIKQEMSVAGGSAGTSVGTRVPNDECIVPSLFRMYIHLGDLHRYSMSYAKAQACYLKASQLAPGHGNPYNQLAVVAQLKDAAAPLNCVALYWYARSLLTTYDSFEISKANLSRLFQSNREWLLQQKQTKDYVKSISESTAFNMSNNNNSKALKTIASRHFLSEFVDLHYSLFREEEQQERNSLILLETKIKDTIQLLESLLKASAFGDSLLCKMVAIHAFSECYIKKANRDNEKAKTKKTSIARLVTLLFGTTLAKRVGVEKKHSCRLLSPLLLLCEYVESRPMFISFDDNFEGNTIESTYAQLERSILNDFGKNLVQVLNWLQQQQRSSTGGNNKLGGCRWLKEYQGLLGYSPFSFINDEDMKIEQRNGFITPTHAADVLELNKTFTMSQTQDSTSTGNTSMNTSSTDENKIKVKRFLALGKRLVEGNANELMRRFNYNVDGSYKWDMITFTQASGYNKNAGVKTSFERDQLLADENKETELKNVNFVSQKVSASSTPTKTSMIVPEDDGGDVFIFNAPEDSNSALLSRNELIPNKLLDSSQSNSGTPYKGNEYVHLEKPRSASELTALVTTTPKANAVVKLGYDEMKGEEKSYSLASPVPPVAMPPPPGFGPSIPTVASGYLGHSGITQHSNLNLQPFQQLGVNPNSMALSQGKTMPPGFGQIRAQSLHPSHPMQQSTFSSHPPPLLPGFVADHDVFGDLRLFGGASTLQTSNPFMAPPPPGITPMSALSNNHGYGHLGYDGFQLNAMNSGDAITLPATSIGRSFLESTPNSTIAGLSETSLLDSGLLQSLWIDDGTTPNKTNNPFATTN